MCVAMFGEENAEGAPNFSYLVTYNYNVATLH
jgi:hypothetical protein